MVKLHPLSFDQAHRLADSDGYARSFCGAGIRGLVPS